MREAVKIRLDEGVLNYVGDLKFKPSLAPCDRSDCLQKEEK